MDQIGSTGIDLDSDIDLETGGPTSEEDSRKGEALSNKKSRISGKLMSSESSYGSTDAGDSSTYENLSSFDEIGPKKKEMKLQDLSGSLVDKTSDKKRVREPSAARPPRPHRPPEGPSLSPYDMRLLKEIYELNLSRKRMGKIRTFNKMKRQKASSVKSNLLAFFVTIIFFAVIILQGILGSRV